MQKDKGGIDFAPTVVVRHYRQTCQVPMLDAAVAGGGQVPWSDIRNCQLPDRKGASLVVFEK